MKKTRIMTIVLLTSMLISFSTACGKNEVSNEPIPSVQVSSEVKVDSNGDNEVTEVPQNTLPGVSQPSSTPEYTETSSKPKNPPKAVPTLNEQNKYKIISTRIGTKFISELQGEFQKTSGNTSIFTKEDIDEAGGLKSIKEGKKDFAVLTRHLNANEKALNLKEHLVAYDAVAIIVNNGNTVKDLSKEQIKNIYVGKITDWSQVGGNPAPIQVLTQPMNNNVSFKTVDTFFTILGLWKDPIKRQSLISGKKSATTDSENGTIDEVASNRNAIGFVSFDSINETSVYPIDVEGVEPSVDNLKSGQYSLSMPFILVTDSKPKPVINSLIEYISGPKGKQNIASQGYIN